MNLCGLASRVARLQLSMMFILTLTLVLGACGSSRPQPPPDHLVHFETSTSESGLRLFTYQVDMPRAPMRSPMTSPNTRRETPTGANPRGRAREQFDASLDAGLRQELDTSGYCPNGFMILERYRLPGRATIRGECL